MEFKLSDILKYRLKRIGFDNLAFSSGLWNTICEVFLEEKGIDITNYLISVKLQGKTIFIKTNKPVVNAELLLLEDKIISRFEEKMGELYNFGNDFEIKYL